MLANREAFGHWHMVSDFFAMCHSAILGSKSSVAGYAQPVMLAGTACREFFIRKANWPSRGPPALSACR